MEYEHFLGIACSIFDDEGPESYIDRASGSTVPLERQTCPGIPHGGICYARNHGKGASAIFLNLSVKGPYSGVSPLINTALTTFKF